MMIGWCSHSVGHYVKAYKQNGLDGLKRATPPGNRAYLVPQRKAAPHPNVWPAQGRQADRTGEILCVEEESYDAEAFLRFLHTVLDNARIHHAKLIQPFLEQHKSRLQLVFLSPYSPQLNLMEGVWKWLKEMVIQNVFFGSVQKIVMAVRAFLRYAGDRPAMCENVKLQSQLI